MPAAIQFFSQAASLRPQSWTTTDQIHQQFEHEGHRSSFLTTVVAYVMALHDIFYLWRRQALDGRLGCLQTRSIGRLYPLSPFQTAIFSDIVDCLAERQRFLQRGSEESLSLASLNSNWAKYRLLLGKPGTGISQVVIHAIHHAIQQEAAVLLAAPVALLAQGYRAIFGADLECETLHAAFHIPVDENQSMDVNFALHKFDLVVIDEASMVSAKSFNIVASTLNRMNCRPVVIIAGDRCQQQPLQTVDGRINTTVSILNDDTFMQENSVKHSLYQQFHVVDCDYAASLDLIRYVQPTQEQLNDFQDSVVLCSPGYIDDDELYAAFSKTSDTVIMTVSRAAAQRVNTIVVHKLFANQQPLTNVPCASVAGGDVIYPYHGMKIVINENRDKTSRIVNGQDGTIVSNHGKTIIIQFADGERAFVYPVTHAVEGQGDVTRYPFTPAYARTICKSQGQNLKHLLVRLYCAMVPPGLAYVALSRIRRKADLSVMQPMDARQLQPVNS